VPRTLKEAMDAGGLTAEEVGSALNRPAQSVRQMRLDPSHANYRPPPDGWETVLARMARERGGALQELADDLERAATGARGDE
jgi:hypothetical protein